MPVPSFGVSSSKMIKEGQWVHLIKNLWQLAPDDNTQCMILTRGYKWQLINTFYSRRDLYSQFLSDREQKTLRDETSIKIQGSPGGSKVAPLPMDLFYNIPVSYTHLDVYKRQI